MSKISLILLLGIISQISLSQENIKFGEKTETEKEYFFALRLMSNFNGGLIQCAIIKKNIDIKDDIVFLTANSWVRQAAGYEMSKANPAKENLFQKYNVFEVPQNATKKGNDEIVFYTIKKSETILKNLWRLKYSEYPFYNPSKNDEKGWAKHSDPKITWLPSEGQMQILQSFGIKELSDFIVAENVFRLLKKVRNGDWQNNYIQNAAENNDEPVNDQ